MDKTRYDNCLALAMDILDAEDFPREKVIELGDALLTFDWELDEPPAMYFLPNGDKVDHYGWALNKWLRLALDKMKEDCNE